MVGDDGRLAFVRGSERTPVVPWAAESMTATEARPTSASPARQGTDDAAEEILRYERSPRDLLRLFVYAAVALLVIALTLWVEDSVLGFEQDVVRVFDFISPSIERVLHGSLEWLGLCISGAILIWTLVTRRFRLLGYVAVAYAVAGGLMWIVLQLLDREDPTLLVNEIAQRAGLSDATTSGEIGFAQFAAAFVVLGPFVSSR